jgi:hypothetical protein
VSAHAPEGTSAANATTDHSMNSVEICAVVSPASAKSSAYTG